VQAEGSTPLASKQFKIRYLCGKDAGWSQPLEDYVAALEGAGLAITSLREPVPDETSEDHLKQWARVPLFLWDHTFASAQFHRFLP
jgi:hypothetical protein